MSFYVTDKGLTEEINDNELERLILWIGLHPGLDRAGLSRFIHEQIQTNALVNIKSDTLESMNKRLDKLLINALAHKLITNRRNDLARKKSSRL